MTTIPPLSIQPGSGEAGPFQATALAASLTVNDLAKSLAWYCDVAGFAVDRKYERGDRLVAVALRAGDIKLLLTQDDGAKGADREKGIGFSLQFTTTQNIDEVAARIRNSGGTLASEPVDAPHGARVFRLVDPDGFKLVISSPPPA
jgi:uncharacterized glyoxalase superfamily protein PhnB